MSKFKYTEFEKQMNSVLKHQDEALADIHFPSSDEIDATISRAEALLRSLGYQPETLKELVPIQQPKKVMVVPTWEELCAEAERHVGTGCELESIFTAEELRSNELAIRQLNEEFNVIHRLDALDISIAALAGLVGAAVDILLVGVPTKTPEGLKGGLLANYVRDYFDKKFPEEEMQKLANSKVSKVPYDAQDNRHTTIQVEGLSAYYHRLLQLGHDPLLGFIFGVADILTGRMTTIDKAGNIVSQVMENYADRTADNDYNGYKYIYETPKDGNVSVYVDGNGTLRIDCELTDDKDFTLNWGEVAASAADWLLPSRRYEVGLAA